jgi:prevent-host-death family protein
MYMITLPLAKARSDLSRLVESAQTTHERIMVTKNGRHAAVILGAEDYAALTETIEILSQPGFSTSIEAGRREIAQGETHSRSEVETAMRAAGRL